MSLSQPFEEPAVTLIFRRPDTFTMFLLLCVGRRRRWLLLLALLLLFPAGAVDAAPVGS